MRKFIVKNYPIGLILIFAFLLRLTVGYLLLNNNMPQNDDALRYQEWGVVGATKGPAAAYGNLTTGPNNQPPGITYISTLIVLVVGPNSLAMKTIPILADIILGLLIFLTVAKYSKRKYAYISCMLFLFNPIVFYNSTIWGQTDALNNLLLYGALLCLLGKKYFFTILLFTLSLFVKLSLLPLLPLIMILTLKSMGGEYRRMIMYLVGSLSAVIILTLPISSEPFAWIVQFLKQNSTGELQHITNYTFNFWAIIFNPDAFALVPLSSAMYFGQPLSNWAYLLFLLFYIPILWIAFRAKKVDASLIFLTCALTSIAMFIFLPRMHERYLYPFFPLMATYIGIKKRFYVEYILLCILNFINLYVVFHPIGFIPAFATNIIAHSKIRLGMSLATTIIFLELYIRVLPKTYIPFKNPPR